jgi:hypothetical protein
MDNKNMALDADGNLAPPKNKSKRNPNDTAPSRNVSHEFTKKMVEATEQRKTEALSEDHVVKLHYGFKNQKTLWINADDETRHAIVYGMVMWSGAVKKGMSDISRFFGIKGEAYKDLVAKYSETFDMAKVALKLKIQQNTISLGLQREDLLQLKFNLLLQFGEQTLNPVHEGVEDRDDGKAIEITVINSKEEAEAFANGEKITSVGTGPYGVKLN